MTSSFSAWICVIALVIICAVLSATDAERRSLDTSGGHALRAYALISAKAEPADPGTSRATISVDTAIARAAATGAHMALVDATRTGPPSAHTVTGATAKLATFPGTADGLRALAAYAGKVRRDLSNAGDAQRLKAFDAAFRKRDATIARAALPGFTAMLAAMPANRRGLAALEAIPEQYGPAFVALPPDLQQRYAIAVATRHDAITAVITQNRAKRSAQSKNGAPDSATSR